MDPKTLDSILSYLCDDLGGSWFMTGGALVRLEFDASRGTEDLDLVRMNHPTLSDECSKEKLFRWLIEQGLGPEWVNSAVEPFVKEVPRWSDEVVEIRTGAKGRIFRPNFTLFAYLKLRRGTEVDLSDIKKAAGKCPEGFDLGKFLSWADSKLKARFDEKRSSLGL